MFETHTLTAALIAMMVANFLINTCRAHKAIKLCQEGLSLVSKPELIKQNELYKELSKVMYLTLVRAYFVTNGIQYTIKYSHIQQECGEMAEKCKMSMFLAALYIHQSKYVEAKELLEKALLINTEIGDKNGESSCYADLGKIYEEVGEYDKAKQPYEKGLALTKQIGDRNAQSSFYRKLGTVLRSVSEHQKAKEHFEEALSISKEIGDKRGEAFSYHGLATVMFDSVREYKKAKEYLEKALAICKEIGARDVECISHGILGSFLQSVGEYQQAKERYKKAIAISKEIGDRKAEAVLYSILGDVFQSIAEYQNAKECYELAISLSTEIGNKKGEATYYGKLGTVCKSAGEFQKGKEYHEKALAISKEIGYRKGEGAQYRNLGLVFQSVGEYQKAKEYQEKAFAISKEIGDRAEEAICCRNLGSLFQSVGENQKSKEYHQQAISISREIGDREGEAASNGNLGLVFHSVGEYQKAKEYHEVALSIIKEIGNKGEEGTLYANLGGVFFSVGEYYKAKQYFEKALAIQKEIGDREGEQATYGKLGTVFVSVGEHQKGKDYYEKAIAVQKQFGYKNGEAILHVNLGTVFRLLGKYQDATEHYENALVINKETGERKLEAAVYGNLGIVFRTLGDYEKAREYQEKALVISEEIGDRARQARNYGNLGVIFHFRGDNAEAEKYHKRGLAISEEIGDIAGQFHFLDNLAHLKFSAGNIQETLSYLALSIEKCEQLRGFLGENDQFKISFFHENIYLYHKLSALLCCTGKFEEALYVSELWRARALADLMSAGYFDENQILANHQSRVTIESVMDRERNCTCLYFFYFCEDIFLWILKAGRVVHFRKINGREILVGQGLLKDDEDLEEFFAMESFRGFGISPGEDEPSKNIQTEPKPDDNYCRVISRTGTENDRENDEVKSTLSLCYKLIIAPVVDLIDGPEIIIVPERSLYNIPFAALPDDTGKCLSETFRIRIVPSLTTLKLIQDSPADYHSQTGALIVGNPDVGKVRYKRRLQNILRLPHAEKEAIMVGSKLGVEPLLGKQATKQAVLQAIHSVGLIHFAAHGFEEEGEIVLAPNVGTRNKIPKEEDYLLTMSDISKVRLRAKLVVLSCCHSARGQIKAEGVVGIARAFLGSGARSVLVALWRVQDSATEQFMSRFYEHLVGGDSASESLHEAMKWMRCNGYSDVRQWAPFMLIGDNVAFDFGKKVSF